MSRYQVSDELWSKIQPLIPVKERVRSRGGRPRVDDRKVFNVILFVLRTGCRWNALNATGICSSSTAHLRFQEWKKAGVFLELWKQSLSDYDELKGIQWDCQALDGAITKAPLGGKKPGAIRPIAASSALSEAFLATGEAFRLVWRSTAPIDTILNWFARRWKVFPLNVPKPRNDVLKALRRRGLRRRESRANRRIFRV